MPPEFRAAQRPRARHYFSSIAAAAIEDMLAEVAAEGYAYARRWLAYRLSAMPCAAARERRSEKASYFFAFSSKSRYAGQSHCREVRVTEMIRRVNRGK